MSSVAISRRLEGIDRCIGRNRWCAACLSSPGASLSLGGNAAGSPRGTNRDRCPEYPEYPGTPPVRSGHGPRKTAGSPPGQDMSGHGPGRDGSWVARGAPGLTGWCSRVPRGRRARRPCLCRLRPLPPSQRPCSQGPPPPFPPPPSGPWPARRAEEKSRGHRGRLARASGPVSGRRGASGREPGRPGGWRLDVGPGPGPGRGAGSPPGYGLEPSGPLVGDPSQGQHTASGGPDRVSASAPGLPTLPSPTRQVPRCHGPHCPAPLYLV